MKFAHDQAPFSIPNEFHLRFEEFFVSFLKKFPFRGQTSHCGLTDNQERKKHRHKKGSLFLRITVLWYSKENSTAEWIEIQLAFLNQINHLNSLYVFRPKTLYPCLSKE